MRPVSRKKEKKKERKKERRIDYLRCLITIALKKETKYVKKSQNILLRRVSFKKSRIKQFLKKKKRKKKISVADACFEATVISLYIYIHICMYLFRLKFWSCWSKADQCYIERSFDRRSNFDATFLFIIWKLTWEMSENENNNIKNCYPTKKFVFTTMTNINIYRQ